MAPNKNRRTSSTGAHDDTATDHDERLALLLSDLTDAVQRGEAVDLEAVCVQNPDLAQPLRELWGAVLVADAVGSHSRDEVPDEQDDAPSTTLELPCRFGDYELLEELGRGGMGVVYRARQIGQDHEVAVKMILRGQLASAEDRERFRAEAEAASRLDHPGIVPVHEVGELDGRPYFSMKYIRGPTLSQLLADGPLPPRETAGILDAVSRAIHFAHQNGVLHRDLKPSNILIDEDGQPHLTDFGLAKRITDAVSITKSGAVLGTPAYMAPEQAAGARGEVSPVSDVYSLGAILYHMLTGRPPFQAASPVDTVLMVLEQDPVPPRVINATVDRDLEMIALRCLQKPPDLRYGSAESLAGDLDAFLHNKPIAARSGRFLQVLARLFRETHHATVLENWGLLWMWHSLVVLIGCTLTNVLYLLDCRDRWYYVTLWTAGLGAWAVVFWALRRRVGPVTFVERQIAHVWAATAAAIGLLFFVETLLVKDVLKLSPILALITGMMFFVKAGILSGSFYFQTAALFCTAFIMALLPDYSHFIFGVVAAGCFFFPGLKYHRQRLRADAAEAERGSLFG
ncbi:MAG: protein kinase [Planctomycetes bacterium]|nr:protein kinase [Planctomycetota bacterium]MBL7044579.1 protein kinase [Pirellulaceae bacterium]